MAQDSLQQQHRRSAPKGRSFGVWRFLLYDSAWNRFLGHIDRLFYSLTPAPRKKKYDPRSRYLHPNNAQPYQEQSYGYAHGYQGGHYSYQKAHDDAQKELARLRQEAEYQINEARRHVQAQRDEIKKQMDAMKPKGGIDKHQLNRMIKEEVSEIERMRKLANFYPGSTAYERYYKKKPKGGKGAR